MDIFCTWFVNKGFLELGTTILILFIFAVCHQYVAYDGHIHNTQLTDFFSYIDVTYFNPVFQFLLAHF